MVPKLVTGQFDAQNQKSVWPSTGNFCRGGAFNATILACESIAIMPENMSKERFDWLSGIVSETLRISGGDSNVKAVFDCVNEFKRSRSDAMIFNQFDEMGNHLWHYHVTGTAAHEAFLNIRRPGDRFAGVCFATGSAGTIGCADYLKEKYPCIKVSAVESLQCPTMLNNGFGEHRIEGIGDRHVPWIHNIRNTDNVICIDDNDPMRILRLFNEKAGREYLKEEAKVDPEFVDNLDIFGISGIANVLACIKMAKYYELTEKDIIGTVLTDTSALYQSRIRELAEKQGEYSVTRAAVDHAYDMHDRSADGDIEHQIWNALVPMLIAKTLKISS
jgi:cysteine synthase